VRPKKKRALRAQNQDKKRMRSLTQAKQHSMLTANLPFYRNLTFYLMVTGK